MNLSDDTLINQLEAYKTSGLLFSKLFSSNNTFLRQESDTSYKTFWNECLILINQLSDEVKKHSRIALSVSDSKQYLKVIFSLWALEKSVVLLSSKMPHLEISDKMKQTNTTILIDNFFISKLEEKDSIFSEFNINIHKESLIVFTSGSSGGPKGVRLSLKNLIASALGTIQLYSIDKDDTWLLSLPLHHVGGLLIPIRSLMAKASIINSSPRDLTLDIIKYSPRFLSLVSTQLQRLIEIPEVIESLQKAKGIIIGGGPTSDSLLKRCEKLKLNIANSYGQSESAAQVCSTRITTNYKELKSAGKPLLFRNVQIKDDTIEITGETVSLGYIQNGIESNFDDNKIITTDLASFDEFDNLILKGRSDQVFISGGENINPNEIENVIKKYPNITEAIVVPVEHRDFGLVPYAFISYKKEINTQELKEFIKTNLSSYHCPKDFTTFNDLPKNDEETSIKYKRSDLIKYAQKLYSDPGHKFNWLKKGNLKGEVIVFLHGFMGSSEDFQNISKSLEDRYFCILIDLPGHGLTPSDNFTDLTDVIAELDIQISSIGTKLHLLGYSQGGRIAFGLALNNPNIFKSLIIESSNPGIEDEVEKKNRYNKDQELLLNVNSQDEIKMFLKNWYKNKLFGNFSKNQNYSTFIESRSKENSSEWRKSLKYLSVGNQPNYWPLLESLSTKIICHIISGQQDTKYRGIANRISKQAKFTSHVIADSAHNTHFENKSLFLELICKILPKD